MIQFGLLIIAIVGLVYKIAHKKPPCPEKTSGYFLICFKGNRLSVALLCILTITHIFFKVK